MPTHPLTLQVLASQANIVSLVQFNFLQISIRYCKINYIMLTWYLDALFSASKLPRSAVLKGIWGKGKKRRIDVHIFPPLERSGTTHGKKQI